MYKVATTTRIPTWPGDAFRPLDWKNLPDWADSYAFLVQEFHPSTTEYQIRVY